VVKICSKCHSKKPEPDFPIRNNKTGKRRNHCKACAREMSRAHYRKSRSAYIERNRRAHQGIRSIILAAKDKPCADCGNQFEYWNMEFDHRNPADKRVGLGDVRRMGRLEVIAEIEKCDVVCVRCHRNRTYNSREGAKAA
jgi:5-methylcytosine-specific restriction endonuclease McrA